MALALALGEGLLLMATVLGATLYLLQPILVDWIDVANLLGQCLVLAASCIVAFYYNDLYDLRVARSLADYAPRLLQAFGVTFIILAAFYLVFPGARLAEGPFVSSFALVGGLILPLRAASYAFLRSRPFSERVLVLGSGSLARQLVEEIGSRVDSGYVIAGVADNSGGDPGPGGYAVLGPLDHVAKMVEDLRVDRVVVALAERRGQLPVQALLDLRARGVAVEEGIDVYERLTGKMALEALTPYHLIFSRGFRKSARDLALGRGISILAAAGGLACLAPLMALIALAIRLDSRGPVFFLHERIGLKGRRFRLVKFRTMHPLASPEAATSEWVRDNEERVTRVGRVLRTFRLDELPQFINVLRGDINLVGPRPHPVSNYDLFLERVPYYRLRLSVRPGVTGWAQIRYGYANSLEEEIEKMRYDLYYIKNLSIWLDLRVLFDTVKTVLFGRGSYRADAARGVCDECSRVRRIE